MSHYLNTPTTHANKRGLHLHISPSVLASSKETLRWKYHAPWQDKRNHLQKVIVDISKIPAHDAMMGAHSYSVHQPSRALCPEESFDIRIRIAWLSILERNDEAWKRYASNDVCNLQQLMTTHKPSHHRAIHSKKSKTTYRTG
jgi:hypothetical protein